MGCQVLHVRMANHALAMERLQMLLRCRKVPFRIAHGTDEHTTGDNTATIMLWADARTAAHVASHVRRMVDVRAVDVAAESESLLAEVALVECSLESGELDSYLDAHPAARLLIRGELSLMQISGTPTEVSAAILALGTDRPRRMIRSTAIALPHHTNSISDNSKEHNR